MAQNYHKDKVYEIVNLADKVGNNIPLSSANFDSFARLRTSDPYTIGDYTHLYNINPEFLNVTSGTGATVLYVTNKSCASIVSGTGTSSYAIHQTKRYHSYFPGKSQLILNSFIFGTGTTNATKKVGYFDDRNGIYLEQVDSVLNLVIRTDVNGTVEERRVPQSEWNLDKCNGTGPSGFNLDPTKTQLAYITFQWLGVGSVECGFEYNKTTIPAHRFDHVNNLETVYIRTPTLPIRSEVRNNGVVSTGNSMQHICSTVISEGGYENSGEDFAITNTTLKSIGIGATSPILAIKLKDTFDGFSNRVTVKLNSVNVFTSGANIKYTVVKLDSTSLVSGGTWNSVHPNSAVEYNEGVTSWIDGEPISAGFVAADTQGGKAISTSASPTIDFGAKKNYISQNFNSNNSQVFLVFAQNISSVDSTSVGAAIIFREIY